MGVGEEGAGGGLGQLRYQFSLHCLSLIRRKNRDYIMNRGSAISLLLFA